MTLALFALALIASLRGWFPWAFFVFAISYAFSAYGVGLISHGATLNEFGITTSAGEVVDYFVGGILGVMVAFERF